jgi:acetyl-CoA C-acetyltransferase
MGITAENLAEDYSVSKADSDQYSYESHLKAGAAYNQNLIQPEIAPVKFERVDCSIDEHLRADASFAEMQKLKPTFKKDGTVTAANASTMNDGASALILASKEKVQELGLKPIAKILGFADAAQDPLWFTTAPALAIPKAIKNAGITEGDVDFYEINEAFAAVAIANQRQLNLDNDKLNVYGGAVSLGHPLGASGARIITTLSSVLRQKGGNIGVAGICNGGGGASAIVIEKI